MPRLVFQIERLRSSKLHPCRKLVAAYPCIQPLIPCAPLRVPAVQRVQDTPPGHLAFATHKLAGLVWEKIGYWCLCAGINDRTAVLGRKKCAVPVFDTIGGIAPVVGHDHVCWEVLVH